MTYFNTISFESNKQIKINFYDGGLSLDAGFLFIKEFACKVGLVKLVKNCSTQMTLPCLGGIRMQITSCR